MSDRLKVAQIPPRTNRPNAVKSSDGGDTLPTDYMPVITLNNPREIQFMRWGLVPHFVSDIKQAGTMFNARAETLLQLPSFRDLVMSSRCLILSEGFYERETQGDEKVEWKIAPAQEDYFYEAGLWTTWKDRSSNEIVESFTMITCDPGESAVGKLHDRMPIIMNQEQRRLWMNPRATQEQVMGLLRPCPDDMLVITEHSRKAIKLPKSRRDDNFDLFN